MLFALRTSIPRMAGPLSALLLAAALSATAHAAGVPGQGSWETTLLGRDIHRQPVAASSAQAVYLYDTRLDVTWLRSAPASPFVDWTAADDWASQLVTGAGASAVSDWRLPVMRVPNPASITTLTYDGSSPQGYNVPGASSEMASLFYDTLGNQARYDTNGLPLASGYGLSNSGSFLNLVAYPFWMGTDRGVILAGRDVKGTLDLRDGLQWYSVEEASLRALAVRSGDVMLAVPEPAHGLLLALGLCGVVSIAARRLGTVVRR